VECNGDIVDRGVGANALGGPVAALAHLVDLLGSNEDGPMLKAGEIVTTGRLTRAVPIRPGERSATRVEG
jgi:2-keto-4-pentenoate hydratase